ncbi:hypothetical protein HDU91_002577, partial [Kappamyces sp. JEL0680]
MSTADDMAMTAFLYQVTSWLEVVGSVAGFYGSLWILVQYKRKNILNNFPGKVIATIAFTDILTCIYFLGWAMVDLLPGFATMPLDGYRVLDAIFNFSLTSCAYLGFLLALNTFYVLVYPGKSRFYETWRWVLIVVVGTVLPLLTFFLPLSLASRQQFFVTMSCSDSVNPRCSYLATIFLFSTVGFAVFCNLLTYLGIARHLKAEQRVASDPRQGDAGLLIDGESLVMKLVKAYSLAIVASFVPFFVQEFMVLLHPESADMTKLDVAAVAFMIRCFILSSRGYIHALAVFYVSAMVSLNGRSVSPLRALFLLFP